MFELTELDGRWLFMCKIISEKDGAGVNSVTLAIPLAYSKETAAKSFATCRSFRTSDRLLADGVERRTGREALSVKDGSLHANRSVDSGTRRHGRSSCAVLTLASS